MAGAALHQYISLPQVHFDFVVQLQVDLARDHDRVVERVGTVHARRDAGLVLDEATSLLDIPSEQMVQRALRTMLGGRTALIIAHRLSTVEIADRVLVLDRGRVVQDGPPDRLLADEGRFARMHQSWRASLA